jgi:hypothetical protein
MLKNRPIIVWKRNIMRRIKRKGGQNEKDNNFDGGDFHP